MAAHTDNAVLIDAPMQLVWETTNDITTWPTLFTEYSAVEILHQSGDTVRFRLTTHADPTGNVWSWVSERVVSPRTRTARAHRIQTGWFEYMHILWTYRQTPDGVEMRWIQDFTMKPDAPLDDAAMTARINANTTTQQTRIKQLIETRTAACAAQPPVSLGG
jgi:aromatase